MVNRKPSLKPFVQSARDEGAAWARAVKASCVVTAPWVRFKCQYGCGQYDVGRNCPPRTPTPAETAAVVACYDRAIMAVWDAPPKDKERRAFRRRMHEYLAGLERSLFLDGYYKALAFVSGPCNLCPTCDLTKPCKRPGEPRVAMEAAGMDVYATLANAGYELRVVRDRCDHYKMCGLVLVD